MTPKEKAKQLLTESTGANYSTPREKEVAQYWQARNIIKEVIIALELLYSTDKEKVSWKDTYVAKYWADVLFYVESDR